MNKRIIRKLLKLMLIIYTATIIIAFPFFISKTIVFLNIFGDVFETKTPMMQLCTYWLIGLAISVAAGLTIFFLIILYRKISEEINDF